MPRVVERRPYPGDVTPIGAKVLRRAWRTIPKEYWVGLREVEFRPRCGPTGDPWAYYMPREAKVVVYSLPLQVPAAIFNPSYLKGQQAWGARLEGGMIVWPDARTLSIWFFDIILLHELGHHFEYRYRNRRSNERQPLKTQERLADEARNRLLADRNFLFPLESLPAPPPPENPPAAS